MSTALDTMRLIRDTGLRPNERLLLFAMALRADGGTADGMWASQGRLADETGLSIRSVQYALKSLESQGVIERSGLRPSKRGRPVVQYRIDRQALAAAARPSMPTENPLHATGAGLKPAPDAYELPKTTTHTYAPSAVTQKTVTVSNTLLTANAVNPSDGNATSVEGGYERTFSGWADDEMRSLLGECLIEAAEDHYIDLPYSNVACTQEEQVAWIIRDLEADMDVDRPLPYLLAIYNNDGAYQFGLAVKEKWKQSCAWRGRARSA